MFKLFVLAAVLAVAAAGVVSPVAYSHPAVAYNGAYSAVSPLAYTAGVAPVAYTHGVASPYAYTAGVASPYAYSAGYVKSAYSAPVAYSGYPGSYVY